jgi:2-polyprenyl-3-methyl-5-hydroxy-6-metoxy-1,4-benzoquinol methylase
MTSSQEWDDVAASFDDEPDHGLRDPHIRESWTLLLREHLPAVPSTVLDLGCGTGTLSVLLAALGYTVTGVDASSRMLAQARAKADREQVRVSLAQGDAAQPPVSGRFDVLLCRHVLWALPDPERVLETWKSLLRPGGRLILIEGLWSTGAGTTATDLLPSVERAIGPATLVRLVDPGLWGQEVDDERYLISVVV